MAGGIISGLGLLSAILAVFAVPAHESRRSRDGSRYVPQYLSNLPTCSRLYQCNWALRCGPSFYLLRSVGFHGYLPVDEPSTKLLLSDLGSLIQSYHRYQRCYKMSPLDPPTYLASLQNNIRQRPIPWDGAVRAGTLTDHQLAKIRAVDKVKRDARKQTVEADLDAYRTLFVGEPGHPGVLESAAKRQDVLQYILVLLNDLLESTCLLLLP